MEDKTRKFILSEDEIPTSWYNINPDLPKPLAPPISPITGRPCSPEELTTIFAEELINQEVSMERFIEIPAEILKFIGCGGLPLSGSGT